MKTNVLIVEDEGLIALDLKKKLEQAGYEVPLIADNSIDALRGVESIMPDLVLMDIRLRGPQDGIQTADQIRRRFHIPVMYVTAHADRETLERAKITEPFGYIVKPFHGVDFRAQIEMALWKQKMEQRLRVSEAWLSAICRNVAEALISTDTEGKIAFMNPPACRLTGWDWKEARGKPLLEVFQVFEETTGLPVVHPLDAIYDGREVATEAHTYRLRSRIGDDSAIVEARLSANRDAESLLGVIVVFSEVTERRKSEEQRHQLQKMSALAQMATGLGQELDYSQRRMDDALSQLLANIGQEDKTTGPAGEVRKRVAYQQSVAQQLIRLGRMDSRNAAPVDLNAVIHELQPQLNKAIGVGRTLKIDLQPGIPAIRVDAEELRETLLQLATNARNSLPDGGLAEISTTVDEVAEGNRTVRLTVWDNGKGIRAYARDRIFDPYYASRPGNGSPGFSLALAYQFAAASGGNIDVESGTGEGTAYVLSFPVAEASGAQVGRKAAGKAAAGLGAASAYHG
jgi:PAS domain S-box-containing protein